MMRRDNDNDEVGNDYVDGVLFKRERQTMTCAYE